MEPIRKMFSGSSNLSRKRKYCSSYLFQIHQQHREFALAQMVPSLARGQEQVDARFSLRVNNERKYDMRSNEIIRSNTEVKSNNNKRKKNEVYAGNLNVFYDEKDEDENEVEVKNSYLYRTTNAAAIPRVTTSADIGSVGVKNPLSTNSDLLSKRKRSQFPSYSKKWENLRASVSKKNPTLSSHQSKKVVRKMFMDSLNSGSATILKNNVRWSKGFDISGKR